MAIFILNASIADAAVDSVAIPPSVEPGRVSQQIKTAPQGRPRAKYSPSITRPSIATPLPAKVGALKFQVNQIVITGNTLYSNEELLKLFPHKLHTSVTLADIQALADAITAKYANAGYIFSQAWIPPQHIKNGVIHIRIVEGYVDKATIKGSLTPATQKLLMRYAEKAIQSRPFQVRDLERAMLLVNDIPGIEARSVLVPSRNKPGAADLMLIVVKKNIDTALTWDNRGTRYIGPTRLIFSVDTNYTLGDGAMTSIQGAASGGAKEMRFLSIDQKQLIGISGFFIDINGALTHTEPKFLLDGTDTIGRSKSLQLTLQYPWIRSRDQNLYVNGGFNYINTNVMQLATKVYADQIRSFQLGTSYNLSDTHKGLNQLSGTLTQGTRLFGASGYNNMVSRYLARPGFTKFNANISRLQGLPKNFSLLLAASGQYAFNRLYSYEQFSYGGLPFGNAYDPSEIIGDRGITGKVELRLDTHFNPARDFALPVQWFVYYDGGRIWNLDSNNQPGVATGTSAGFGFRSSFLRCITVSMELDKPLDRKVAVIADTPSGGNPKGFRGFFVVSLNGCEGNI